VLKSLASCGRGKAPQVDRVRGNKKRALTDEDRRVMIRLVNHWFYYVRVVAMNESDSMVRAIFM